MKVYFYLLPPSENDASKALYKPHLLSLAEGLKSKGIPFFSNINWWNNETNGNEFLFKKTTESPSTFPVIVVGSELFQSHLPLPQFFKSKTNKIIMYDWIASVFFNIATQKRLKLVDKYLYYSYSQNVKECIKNLNVSSWPIGLTNRSINYSHKYSKSFSDRTNHILWAHRNGHPIRDYVKKYFYTSYFANSLCTYNDQFSIQENEEIDKRYWVQTGRRHNKKFYEALGNSKIVDCCGGYFIENQPKKQLTLNDKKINIRNWDNYKIWEGFAAGCCVITLDLDYYGFVLPTMPLNGFHYIGLKLNDLGSTYNKIITGEYDIEKIADNGRAWALENYSPESMAAHFLNIV